MDLEQVYEEWDYTGQVIVYVTTSGSGFDPDGYVVAAGGEEEQFIWSSAYFSLPSGPTVVELRDVAANCAVQGANQVEVDVVTRATLQVDFYVDCAVPQDP